MVTSTIRSCALTALATAALAVCGVARAQMIAASTRSEAPSSPPAALEEITVTARKRSESLIDVPVAVSAVTGAELQRQGVTDLNQIAQMVPAVILGQSTSGTGASFTIRGIGTTSQDPGLDQSVTVVLDGSNLSRGQLINMGMFDLAQVEVLKGPQALFFGKNSPAGVIALTSAGATDELAGYVRAGYETVAEEEYAEAAVSGPLTDQLKARVAFRGSTMRGWLENVAQPIAGTPPFFPETPGRPDYYAPGIRQIMGRVTLAWTPTDNFTATLKYNPGEYKDAGGTAQSYCASGAPPSAGGAPDPYLNCAFDNTISVVGVLPKYITPAWQGYAGTDGKPYTKVVTNLSNLTLNYNVADINFTSVTSYFDLKYTQNSNFDKTSYGLANGALRETTDEFAQELRMVSNYDSPLNYTLGAYYEHVDRETGTAPLVLFLGPDPNGDYFSSNSSARTHAQTVSGFGQLRWAIIKKLELAAGVRWTRDSRDLDITNKFVNPYIEGILGLVPAGIATDGASSNTNWSPEATLSYKPIQDVLFYAAYKTGYKAGGFGTPYLYQKTAAGLPPTAEDLAFKPEKVQGGEVGFKAQLADRTVRIESVLYNYNYSDLQVSVFNPASFSFTTKNAASARTRGVEVSVDWQASRHARLFGSVAYNQGKYVNYTTAQCYVAQTSAEGCLPVTVNGSPTTAQNFDGRPLTDAPRWNFAGGASYDENLSARWMLGFNADVNYTSSYDTDPNKDPGALQGGFARVNAGIRLYSADEHYEFAVIGRDLANKYYKEFTSSDAFAVAPGQLSAATPRAREIKLQGAYRF